MDNLDALKYPIGKFVMPHTVDQNTIAAWIKDIKDLPSKLDSIASRLTESNYTLVYRPGGWNIREVIHHMADSHMNAFIRIKLALTEENPTVKPYFEEKWATTTDVQMVSPLSSIMILKGLHTRWANLLENCSPDLLERRYYHPEHQLSFPIIHIIGMYAWHSNHHLAHIELALSKK